MNREGNMVWIILLIIGALGIGVRAMVSGGMGKGYVETVTIDKVMVGQDDDGKDIWTDADSPLGAAAVAAGSVSEDDGTRMTWSVDEQSSYTDFAVAEAAATATGTTQTIYGLSLQRTIGIWFAALMTLFVMTFLIKDNPLYKIAESIFIGVSAAYWMVVGFWTTVVPNLFGKLSPDFVRDIWGALPGLSTDEPVEWKYLVPLVLGVMLLWRLAPKGGWISRYPMAFIIGVFCGLRLITFLHADFLSQIRNGIYSLWITDGAGAFDFWASLRSVFLVAGVLTCLVYFFFSIEHKGVVGHTARVGIWFLMITFGAAFGYTVMGRIALLAIRLEFLFDDWLWLIDPTGKRVVEAASILWYPMVA